MHSDQRYYCSDRPSYAKVSEFGREQENVLSIPKPNPKRLVIVENNARYSVGTGLALSQNFHLYTAARTRRSCSFSPPCVVCPEEHGCASQRSFLLSWPWGGENMVLLLQLLFRPNPARNLAVIGARRLCCGDRVRRLYFGRFFGRIPAYRNVESLNCEALKALLDSFSLESINMRLPVTALRCFVQMKVVLTRLPPHVLSYTVPPSMQRNPTDRVIEAFRRGSDMHETQ